MYRTILIPLENSPVDEAILAHIRQLARLCSSRLILVHVADGFVARYQDQLDLQDSEEMRVDRAYLDRRQRELAAEGFDVATYLARGEPTKRILELAEREQCDLIAMSTHGHGFIKDLLLGSVASSVRHRTSVPVLLLRTKPE